VTRAKEKLKDLEDQRNELWAKLCAPSSLRRRVEPPSRSTTPWDREIKQQEGRNFAAIQTHEDELNAKLKDLKDREARPRRNSGLKALLRQGADLQRAEEHPGEHHEEPQPAHAQRQEPGPRGSNLEFPAKATDQAEHGPALPDHGCRAGQSWDCSSSASWWFAGTSRGRGWATPTS